MGIAHDWLKGVSATAELPNDILQFIAVRSWRGEHFENHVAQFAQCVRARVLAGTSIGDGLSSLERICLIQRRVEYLITSRENGGVVIEDALGELKSLNVVFADLLEERRSVLRIFDTLVDAAEKFRGWPLSVFPEMLIPLIIGPLLHWCKHPTDGAQAECLLKRISGLGRPGIGMAKASCFTAYIEDVRGGMPEGDAESRFLRCLMGTEIRRSSSQEREF